jgi:hypothetical protein
MFCIPLAGIKIIMLKIERGENVSIGFPAICSPLTEITVDKNSKLKIGRQIKMHNGSKIRV